MSSVSSETAANTDAKEAAAPTAAASSSVAPITSSATTPSTSTSVTDISTAAPAPTPATMQAVVYNKYGPVADVLSIVTNYPAPARVQNRQVLVKIHAAAINPADYKFIRGDLSMVQGKPPFVVGHDGAGTVLAVGPFVKRFKVGDEVYFASSATASTFAQFIAIDEKYFGHKPKSLNWKEAASLPIAATTALGTLQAAGLKAGQKVLVIGGSGGVGIMAIQIAKALGAARVAAVTSAKNADFVQSLGADTVVDYTTKSFAEELKGQNYDIVLDTVGGKDQWLASHSVLKKSGGQFVTIVGDKAGSSKLTVGGAVSMLGTGVVRNVAGIFSGPKYHMFLNNPTSAQFDLISKFVEEGKLKTFIEKEYEWTKESIVEMFKAIESGHTRGKLVVTIPEGGETPAANESNANKTPTPSTASATTTAATESPPTASATAGATTIPKDAPASAASTTEISASAANTTGEKK